MAMTAGAVLADPPVIPRPDRYKDLYLNSMFTDPPPPDEPEIKINDLPDWVLVGVSKYVGKVEVNIMNIKDRTRVRIPSKDATEMGFAIKDFQQGGNYVEDTVVTLQKGGSIGEVRFDTKYLVLKKAAGPAPSKGNPSQSGNSRGAPPAPNSRSNGPPIPGQAPSTGASATAPPAPGATGATSTNRAVPRPTANPTSTNGTTGTTSSKRSRWAPPRK